jgi:hypothetical protein
VRLANSVEVTAQPFAAICPYRNLCIYDGQYGSGYELQFSTAGSSISAIRGGATGSNRSRTTRPPGGYRYS